MDIKINVGSGRRDLQAALWWPEGQAEQHDDIDLYLINPSGSTVTNSISSPSVFERTAMGGALASGTWTIRIKGHNVQSGPQTVYWTVDVHGCG